ncbi:MAG: multicopper oxidase domain-containing protein [Woeseiaceae bacterium]|nr:multicopper oxidase domain-containing protein [Woeseiaceae bacterium]
MSRLRRHGPWILVLLVGLAAWPPQWYPEPLRVTLTRWFGAADYRPLPASRAMDELSPERFCPPDPSGWRAAQTIDGVAIAASPTCAADNPHAVAAFVRGTNNVSGETLAASGLTADAVEKGRDLDGDGDPDEIHIRLEVAELNGASPIDREPVTRYAIAPGVEPGLWVFAPKLVGMAVENIDTQRARDALRLPSPAIRIEQGDRVRITLENSHYMPHTLHLHGADHGFTTGGRAGQRRRADRERGAGAARCRAHLRTHAAACGDHVLSLSRATARARHDGPAGSVCRSRKTGPITGCRR